MMQVWRFTTPSKNLRSTSLVFELSPIFALMYTFGHTTTFLPFHVQPHRVRCITVHHTLCESACIQLLVPFHQCRLARCTGDTCGSVLWKEQCPEIASLLPGYTAGNTTSIREQCLGMCTETFVRVYVGRYVVYK